VETKAVRIKKTIEKNRTKRSQTKVAVLGSKGRSSDFIALLFGSGAKSKKVAFFSAKRSSLRGERMSKAKKKVRVRSPFHSKKRASPPGGGDWATEVALVFFYFIRGAAAPHGVPLPDPSPHPSPEGRDRRDGRAISFLFFSAPSSFTGFPPNPFFEHRGV